MIMKLLIYNSSSFGGIYAYSKEIYSELSKHADVEECKIVFPKNVVDNSTDFLRILKPDVIESRVGFFRKLYFVYRSIVNPFILWAYLRKCRGCNVIFNDFDQLTSVLYFPFFRMLKQRHRFSIILHDPDRDAYFPVRLLSELTMKCVMSFMDIAFYHEQIPERKYYHRDRVSFVEIPHGIYQTKGFNESLANGLRQGRGEALYLSIIGNVRREKNYELAIRVLKHFSEAKLIVAGRVANSSVSIVEFKNLAERCGVEKQIVWINKYLTDEEMNAVIECSDVVLLYYSRTFTSNSGILNLVAPFRKMLVVSDTESSLTRLVREYGLGVVADADSEVALREAVGKAIGNLNVVDKAGWDRYLAYASWAMNARKIVEAFKFSTCCH